MLIIKSRNPWSSVARFVVLGLLLSFAPVLCFAQSVDANAPTPVTGSEIAGRILPLDVGDARQTRYFYIFGGTNGDLEITVESQNLDGDVDLFAANGLRPLTKFTLYATSGDSISVTKTVFLRRAESLILRVQARTPNDEAGTYRVRFGGTFVAATDTGGKVAPTPAIAPNVAGASRSSAGRVTRVTTTGARIDEPLPLPDVATTATDDKPSQREVARREPAPPTPRAARRTTRNGGNRVRGGTPRPAPAPIDEATNANRPAETGGEASGNVAPAAARPTKDARTRPARPTRARNSPPKDSAAATNRARKDDNTRDPATAAANNEGARPVAASNTAPVLPPLQQPGARLVIELQDGTLIEREMISVRRVTIEGTQIVVVLKSGKVERQSLQSVLRMSIVPAPATP